MNIKETVSKQTKASFALEGRTVPDNYVRSESIQKFLDERLTKSK